MSFVPNPEFVASLESLIATSISGSADGRAALEQITALQQQQDFFTYCAAIMCEERDPAKASIRAASGYYLKRNVVNPNCSQNAVVRDYVMRSLADPLDDVVRSASAIVSQMVGQDQWDAAAVLEAVASNLASQGAVAAPGYLRVLAELIDEHIIMLDVRGVSPVAARALLGVLPQATSLPPLLLQKTGESLALVAEQAACNPEGALYAALNNQDAFNVMIGYLGQAVTQQSNWHLVEHGVRALYFLFAFGHFIAPMFDSIAALMVGAIAASPNGQVRTEVINFWSAVLKFPELAERAMNLMPQVLQMLLAGMVFTPDGLKELGDNDYMVPDRPEDVKPKHYQTNRATNRGGDDDDGNDDDDDDDDAEDASLRKTCAETLDEFAQHFGHRIIDTVLEQVGARMQPNGNWLDIESAVFALGAIAHGAQDFMQAQLPAITARLITIASGASGDHVLTRAIAMWTLSRYSEFIVNEDRGDAAASDLSQIIAILTGTITTATSKYVQMRATIALGDFCDAAPADMLHKHAGAIVDCVITALQRFQLKNRYLLLETATSIVYAISRALQEDEALVGRLMGAFGTIWEQTANDSVFLLVFFPCMGAICEAIGACIEPMASNIFSRAVGIAEHHLGQRSQALQLAQSRGDVEVDYPLDSDNFLIAAVDLLSALCAALGSSLQPLVNVLGAQRWMSLLMGCCQDESPDVRQSAFGVLGELSAHTVGLVQGVLPQLAPIVHQQMLLLDERNYSATSNAAWLLSNVVSHQVEAGGNLLTASSGLDTLALDTVNALRSNEHYTGDATNMCENMCVALGDMLLYDTDLCGRLTAQGAPLASYLKPWCEYTRNMCACAGKDRAIEGVLLALQRDPAAAVGCLDRLFDVAISLPPSLPLEQRNLLGAVFGAIKNGMGAGWAAAIGAYKAESRQVLYQKFAIA